MSLYAYCQKASDGDQNYHCKTKCIKCIIEIGVTQAIWKEKFLNKKER